MSSFRYMSAFPGRLQCARAVFLLTIGLAVAWGRDPGRGRRIIAQGANQGDAPPPFPAIERAERLQRLEAQRQFEEKRRLRLHDVQRLIQLALQKENVTDRLRTLLKGERVLLQMQKEKPEPRVANLLKELYRIIYAQPPPPMIRLKPGLEFVLVPAAGDVPAFYALSRPLTPAQIAELLPKGSAGAMQTPGPPPPAPSDKQGRGAAACADLSWEQAAGVCTMLSRVTGFPMGLPTLAQAERIESAANYAVWTGTRATRVGMADRDLLKKYGVVFYHIVDKGRRLGDGETPAEPPFARYRGLIAIPVTPVRTGAEVRLRQLRNE